MNEWLVTSKTYVRMYLSNNLFCPDKLLVCFYTFLNWHAQTHEEPHEENEKRDRKHFYLAIRNEMFVHRMLWSSNSFSTIPSFFFARSGCVEGTYAPSFPVCKTKASMHIFFLLAELTSVGTCGAIWHKLECISYCTCWDCWANETTRPKRAYWAKLLIRHSLHNLSLEVRFFVLYRYHSIRFLVGAWLLFRSCGAARDKMASHVNQGSSAAGSNRQRINTDQPIQDIVARCRR